MKTNILVDHLKFPESPRWHDGKLWFCDYATNKIMNVDFTGKVQTVLEPDDLPVAIDFTPDGKLLVVSSNQRKLLKLENDKLTEVADMSKLVQYPCGDMVVDARGRAYIGNLGHDFGTAQFGSKLGLMLLTLPNGDTRIVAEGLDFPNGVVITPDSKTLIVAESYGARLTAFDIEANGSLSNRRAWAQFDESLTFEQGRLTPDGICLDEEGAVWVAALKEVLRIREGGEVTHRIPLESYALACRLGGFERRVLFILTTEVLNPFDDKAKGRIESVQVEVPGVSRRLNGGVMKTKAAIPKTIDNYIAGFPKDIQEILEKIRTTIQQAAPDAKEKISYGMPTFDLHGNLVHFVAFKNHIGFYPVPSGIEKFKKELSKYKGAKGSVQFPLDEPMPLELIGKIVKFRIKENLAKVKGRK